MIQFKVTTTTKELQQILTLQQQNLSINLTDKEKQTQGFVTVKHTFKVLYKMHLVHPHIIATYENNVVGYVLSMSKKFGDTIPILRPMFAQLKEANITNDFIIMGQVCISKNHRGKGVFRSLYTKMAKEFSKDFTNIITEVDSLNTRSLNAHKAIGFKDILEYEANGQVWKIISLSLY